jgi:hypothetical protein
MRLAAVWTAGLAAGLALCSACTTQHAHYAWGSYEELIHIAHNKPGTLTPEAQVETLLNEQREAQGRGQPLPPGWHAQLAALYAQSGKVDLAQQELLEEKAAFPESTTLVDRLLANLRNSAEKQQ